MPHNLNGDTTDDIKNCTKHDTKNDAKNQTAGQIKKRTKTTAEMGAHIGSASIVMIFAVLCLTIFAVLSFETAAYEQRLAHKAADAAQAYYAADGIAEERYLEICTLLATETDKAEAYKALLAEQTAEGVRLEYTVPIDGTQELQVELFAAPDGTVQIVRWHAAAAVDWEYEEELQVWDGETDVAES